jgi:hypothetical protein
MRVLILPTPFGTMVDDKEYEVIADWVYTGGGLLTFGNYLMESHLYMNLNVLARRCRFQFERNLLMPKDKVEYRDCMRQSFAYDQRDLWIVTTVRGEPVGHPLLNGVSKIALTSSCSVETTVKPSLTVYTDEPVAVMTARGEQDPGSGKLRNILEYRLEKTARVPVMVAFQYGKGRIVGIGAVKVFANDLVNGEADNMRLFRNAIAWLQS